MGNFHSRLVIRPNYNVAVDIHVRAYKFNLAYLLTYLVSSFSERFQYNLLFI